MKLNSFLKRAAVAAVGVAAMVVNAEIVDVESCTTLAARYAHAVTAMYTHSGAASALFDGQPTGSYWCGDAPDLNKNIIPSVVIDFGSGLHKPVVNAYAVTSFGAHSPSSAPKDWRLSAADSPDGPWTVLDSQSEQTGWASSSSASETRTFTFVNTRAYSCYKIELLCQNSGGRYVEFSELALFHARDTEAFESVSGDNLTYQPGKPTPPYAGLSGCQEGDEITVSFPSRHAVDEETSRRYELIGWSICDYAGTVLQSGTFDDLPTTFIHRGDFAQVVWSWATPTEDAIAAATTDITVPENAEVNSITANGYLTHPPKYAFDNSTSTKWRSSTTEVDPDPWVQYEFKTGPLVVTAFKVLSGSYPFRTYLFEGADATDGEWHELSSGSRPTGIFQVDNHRAYSFYRFHIRDPENKNGWVQTEEIEFYSYRTPDTLEVFGSPCAYGTPTPLYGFHSNLTAGAALACAAPAETIVTAPGVRSACVGHVLEQGTTCVTNDSTSFTYVHGGHGRLTWLWADCYRQSFSATGSGSVDKTEVWAAAGTTVTVTATGGSGGGFAYWSGDVPDGRERQNPLVYQADGPRTIQAVFASPIYVKPASEGGDDANDGLSWATAKATPGAALACDSSAVHLAPGVYEVAGDSLTVSRGILFAGGGDPEQTVLRVLPETLGTGAVLRVTHDLAQVCGLTLEGGVSTNGFAAGLVMTGDGAVSNCVVRNCRALAAGSKGGGVYIGDVADVVGLVVTTNTTAGEGGGLYLGGGGAVRDSRFEGNRSLGGYGGGVRANLADVALVMTNCQFVGNAANGAGGGMIDMAALTMRACVFSKNTANGTMTTGMGGGGLQLYTSETCLIEDTVFADNVTGQYGGGLNSYSARLTARRCVIAGNSGARGGGFGGRYTGAKTLLAQLTVTNNTSTREGGGLFLCSVEMRDSLVAGNVAVGVSGVGGGIETHEGTACLRNVTVTGNRAGSTTGGLHVYANSSTTVYNSILWDNLTDGATAQTNITGTATLVNTCTGDDWRSGTGCIAADPCFTRAAEGDYTLKRGSPCVNAGDNAAVPEGDVDLAGNPRIRVFGGSPKYDVVDMGCYESPHGPKPGFQILIR